MKRLVDYNDAIINNTVLEYYGIEYSSQRDIADIDKRFGYAIMQAITHAIGAKYPNADEEIVHQYVSCLVRCVFHLAPEIALALTKDNKYIDIYRERVNSIRRNLLKEYAAQCGLTNEEIYVIVIKKLLGQLEQWFFS